MLLIKEGGSRGLYNGIKKPQNDVIIKRKNVKTNIEVPKEEKISF
jgi:putative lipoprotein